MISLITVLGELALEGLRKLPNYTQKMEEEFNEKLTEYITEVERENPDTHRIDVILTWLRGHGEQARTSRP